MNSPPGFLMSCPRTMTGPGGWSHVKAWQQAGSLRAGVCDPSALASVAGDLTRGRQQGDFIHSVFLGSLSRVSHCVFVVKLFTVIFSLIFNSKPWTFIWSFYTWITTQLCLLSVCPAICRQRERGSRCLPIEQLRCNGGEGSWGTRQRCGQLHPTLRP